MSVAKALKKDSKLRSVVQSGIQAIEKKDRDCMHVASRKRVVDSLYLDKALQPDHANDFRWDYIVSTGTLYGIETHSATTHEISVVIGKKKWAVARMREHLNDGQFVTAWYWVASGRVDFPDTGKVRRRLNQEGIELPGKSVTLPRPR